MHIIRDGSDQVATVLILAHGAGAGSDSEIMDCFAQSLANAELVGGLAVCRFDFPTWSHAALPGENTRLTGLQF